MHPKGYNRTPCFSRFFGDTPPNKGEVSFDQWLFEIKSIMDTYSETLLKEGIIQSLKGAAADIIHYLGPQASGANMLGKLDYVYGIVASFDVLKQSFYRTQLNCGEYVMQMEMQKHLHSVLSVLNKSVKPKKVKKGKNTSRGAKYNPQNKNVQSSALIDK